MFEVFLRKKSIADFAKEDMQTSKPFISAFIAIIILQILIAILIVSGLIQNNDSITAIIFQFIIWTITSFIFIIIAQGIGSFLFFIFAKLVKGNGSFGQFFFKSLYLYAPFILLSGLKDKLSEIFGGPVALVFGVIGLILAIYLLYLFYGLIKNYFGLSTLKTIFVIVAPIIVIFILIIILAAILGAWFLTQVTQYGPTGFATLFNQ